MATGLTAALNYLVGFAAVKLYVNIEATFTIAGSFLFFGVVNLIG